MLLTLLDKETGVLQRQKGKQTVNDAEKSWQLDASDVPLPPMVPTGHAEFYEKDESSLKFYVEQYQIYGPIFRVRGPDSVITVLAGPAANVFVGRFGTEILSEKAFWQGFDQEYAGRELGGREGDANRQRRALLSRGYSRGGVLDRLPTLVEISRHHMQGWQAGQRVLFFPWIQALVAEQLGQLLTHYGPGEYVPDLDTFLRVATSATMRRTQAKGTLQGAEYLRAKERTFELGRAIVAAHRTAARRQDGQPDLVDDMLEATARAGRVASDEQLALGALGPFLAGLHTVTTASCYLLCSLLSHPDVLARVVKEVDLVLTRGTLTWDALKTMSALQGAMMEVLRLYPVSLGHTCQAIRPFVFAGTRVDAGTDVFVAMTVSHFLADVFPSPECFDSDRYSHPRNEQRKPGAYAPFGLGDHACLGAGIAEIQLMSTIAALLFQYQLALDPPDYVLQPLEVSSSSVKEQFQIRVVAIRHVQQKE